MTIDDPFELDRFVAAQAMAWPTAKGELLAGAKRSHWIWFVFPQIAGLGRSETSRRYAIRSLDEARSYLAHPLLGRRLEEAAKIAADAGPDAETIFGELDAQKLRSSLTLFLVADPDRHVLRAALGRFFNGEPDQATLDILGAPFR